jgi:hypothetical protein
MRPFSLVCLVAALAATNTATAQVIYFLVARYPWPNDASAVIPLSDPDQVSHARDLVAQVGQGTDVNLLSRPWPGVITYAGADGINRNYQDPRLPEWSWHITQVTGFGDAGVPEIFKSPLGLEYEYTNHPNTTGTNWMLMGYTAVQELGSLPLYLSGIHAGQNLQLYWATPGTNYLYTVESSGSLAPSNWVPLPGTAWPVRTNFWSGQVPAQPPQFFRVKAVLAAQKHVGSADNKTSQKTKSGAY